MTDTKGHRHFTLDTANEKDTHTSVLSANVLHIKIDNCTILHNHAIAPDIFEMALSAPGIPASYAGQFVMVYLDKGEHLLPRPISICHRTGDTIFLVYKTVGAGTRHMANLRTGDYLRIMGPLGNGFTVKESLKKVALIGGGIGIPPMVALYNELSKIEADVFLGFRDEPFLTEHFNNPVTTRGNLVDLLKQHGQVYDGLYACGPKPMLEALSEYAKSKNIPLQISLEERMACGLGTCMGCVVPPNYVKVCCDGPVFTQPSAP